METTTEIVDGLQFNRGYVSANFANVPETQRAEYEKPMILITDQKLSAIKNLLPVLELLAKTGKGQTGLVIIADEIDGEALACLALNHVRGTFKSLAIKAPDFGDRRKAQLEDLAIVTGATVISAETGADLREIQGIVPRFL